MYFINSYIVLTIISRLKILFILLYFKTYLIFRYSPLFLSFSIFLIEVNARKRLISSKHFCIVFSITLAVVLFITGSNLCCSLFTSLFWGSFGSPLTVYRITFCALGLSRQSFSRG